jgi:hypothetical protein
VGSGGWTLLCSTARPDRQGMPRRRLQRGCLPFERSSHGLLDLKGSTGAFHLLRRPSAKGGSRDGFRLLRLNNETIPVSGRPVFCTASGGLPIARRQTAQARTHTTGIVVRPAHSRHCRLQAAMRDGWEEYAAGLARRDKYSPGMRRARKCGVISRWGWGIGGRARCHPSPERGEGGALAAPPLPLKQGEELSGGWCMMVDRTRSRPFPARGEGRGGKLGPAQQVGRSLGSRA